MCHGHGALFDIDTGVCTSGPCLGQSLTRVAIERDGEGTLWALELMTPSSRLEINT